MPAAVAPEYPSVNRPALQAAWSPHRRTQFLLTAACCAVGLWTIVSMIIVSVIAYYALPWNDLWAHWRVVSQDGYSLNTFVRLNNEHRIVLPRIWFMLDHALFSGTQTFLYISIYLIQLGHSLLLWRIARRAGTGTPVAGVALGALLTAALFSAQQFWTFTWAFEIQVAGVYLLATAALYALARAEEARQSAAAGKLFTRWLILSTLFAWGAAYTMSNGLIVWPVLLLFALILRLKRGALGVIGINGAAAWVLYFIGYHSPQQHLSPLKSLLNPPQALAFLLTYLGAPLDASVLAISKIFSMGGDNYRFLWVAAAGFAGIVACSVILLRLLENRYSFNRAQLLLAFNLLFLLLTAVATGMGRGIQFNLGEALASRYTTGPIVFWICLLILFWSMKANRETGDVVHPGSLFQFGACVGVFLLVAIHQTPTFDTARTFKAWEGEVEAAVTAGVFDEEVLKRNYFDPAGMLSTSQFLREHRLSVFKQDWTRWPGQKLAGVFDIGASTPTCPGAFESAITLPASRWPGMKVGGWAWDPESKQGPDKVILVNEKQTIMGVAANITERPDVKKTLSSIDDDYVGWRGYVPKGDFKQLSAYLVRKGGRRVCYLGSAQLRMDMLAPSQVGRAFAGAAVQPNGWLKDGYYPNIGKPPLPDEVFGSWNGSDANTGSITIGPFLVPKGATGLALPVVTGPATAQTSIKIVNQETGEELDSLIPVPVLSQWTILRFSFSQLPQDTKVVLQAADNGQGWGQWLAIGQPHELAPGAQ